MGKRRDNSHQIKYMFTFKGSISFFSENWHYFHGKRATILSVKSFFFQKVYLFAVSFKRLYNYASAKLTFENSPTSQMFCIGSSSCTEFKVHSLTRASRLEMDHRQPPSPLAHNLHRQSVTTFQRSTGPDKHPVGSRAKKEPIVTRSQTPKPKQPLQPPATLLGPSPMHPRDPSSAEHSWIHNQPIRRQRRCIAGSPGVKIARPLATVRTRSSFIAFRADHIPSLKVNANLLEPSADPLCLICKYELQKIEHWLR